MNKLNNNYIVNYIENLQSKGKYTFSYLSIQKDLKVGKRALTDALLRQSRKKRIVSVYKGFYVIVPPEYFNQKILPPYLFIDTLMEYINKPYYIGLLNAAAFHGATQYAVQDYTIVTIPPYHRPVRKPPLSINFIAKAKFPEKGIEKKKTDTGYINISNPELTLIDLIRFSTRAGGLDRVINVIHEMQKSVNWQILITILKINIPMAAIQRIGYIVEKIGQKGPADNIYTLLSDKPFFH